MISLIFVMKFFVLAISELFTSEHLRVNSINVDTDTRGAIDLIELHEKSVHSLTTAMFALIINHHNNISFMMNC